VQRAYLNIAALPSERQRLIDAESRLHFVAQTKIRGEAFHSTVSDREFRDQYEKESREFRELCRARVKSRRDEELKLSREKQQELLRQECLESRQREVHASFVKRLDDEQRKRESVVSVLQERINVLTQQQESLAKTIRDGEAKSNMLTKKIKAFLREFKYQREIALDKNRVGYEYANEFISISGIQTTQNRSDESELLGVQEIIQIAERQMAKNRKQIAALEKQRDEVIQQNKSSLRRLAEVQDGVKRSVSNRTARIVRSGIVVHNGGR